MFIMVKAFFGLRDVIGPSCDIEIGADGTLRDVLGCLIDRYGDAFYQVMYDPSTGDLKKENPILVNGRHYRSLEKALDTPLAEGDLVAIFPPVAGG